MYNMFSCSPAIAVFRASDMMTSKIAKLFWKAFLLELSKQVSLKISYIFIMQERCNTIVTCKHFWTWYQKQQSQTVFSQWNIDRLPNRFENVLLSFYHLFHDWFPFGSESHWNRVSTRTINFNEFSLLLVLQTSVRSTTLMARRNENLSK